MFDLKQYNAIFSKHIDLYKRNPIVSMGCNCLSTSLISASGPQLLIYNQLTNWVIARNITVSLIQILTEEDRIWWIVYYCFNFVFIPIFFHVLQSWHAFCFLHSNWNGYRYSSFKQNDRHFSHDVFKFIKLNKKGVLFCFKFHNCLLPRTHFTINQHRSR